MPDAELAPATASDIIATDADRVAALYRLTDRLYRARDMADVYQAALDAVTEAMSCTRASVLLFDDRNVMRFVAWRGLSEHYRTALEGHSPWTPEDRDPPPIFVSDIAQTDESNRVKSAILAEGIRALAFVPLIANGHVVGKFMTYHETARAFSAEDHDLAVTIAHQIGFALERSRAERAREISERELQASEERFRMMAENAPVMMWISDAKGACLMLNRELREFWGIDEQAVKAFNWQDSMHPDDAPEISRKMTDALAQRVPVSIKGRYRNAAGDYRVLQTDARPRFSAQGEFLGMVGVNTDVTEHERAEQQRDILLGELNHRVKNLLAVVQGIAHQTFRTSKTIAEAQTALDGRLHALARAQDMLTREKLDDITLKDLATRILDAKDSPRIDIEGPILHLSGRQALVITMALHELFTNAVKYGALANDAGRVTLSWTLDPATRAIEIVWRESGGPRVVPSEHRGFGTLMLERTLQDVDGRIENDFRPDGLIARITMKQAAEAK